MAPPAQLAEGLTEAEAVLVERAVAGGGPACAQPATAAEAAHVAAFEAAAPMTAANAADNANTTTRILDAPAATEQSGGRNLLPIVAQRDLLSLILTCCTGHGRHAVATALTCVPCQAC